MGILGWIVLGLIAGAIAKAIMPGKDPGGIVITMLLGIVGAIIGGLIADWLDVGSITELNFWGFIFALIAAVLLIGVAEAVSGGRNRAVR